MNPIPAANDTAPAHESRLEVSLTPEGLPQLFRDLASALEGGPAGVLDGADIRGCAKLKIEVKSKAGRVLVKLKAKSGTKTAPEADGRRAAIRPKYGPLKKRLKAAWKAVQEAVAAGAFPDPGLAASFVADSERMVAYPGKGDEYYAPYKAALEGFRQALGSRDLAGLGRACAELERVKVQCHERHK